MSEGALVKMEPQVQSPSMGYTEMEKWAGVCVASGLFSIRNREAGIALMFLAQAQGLHPATVFMEFDVISGRPALKSQAALARFQRSGGQIQWLERSDKVCRAKFSHPLGGDLEVQWDMARAKQMGLSEKDNWKKQPMVMLSWRVVAEGVRAVFPACLGGIFISEEVADMPPLSEETEIVKTLTDKYAKQAALPTPAPEKPADPPPPQKADPPPPPKEEPPAAPQEPQGAAEGSTPDGEDTPQFGDLDPNEPMVTGLIQSISYKDGKKKDGKPYTKWAVKIADVWYGTFDSTFAETAKQAKEMGKAVDLYYRESGQYKNITELVVSA